MTKLCHFDDNVATHSIPATDLCWSTLVCDECAEMITDENPTILIVSL